MCVLWLITYINSMGRSHSAVCNLVKGERKLSHHGHSKENNSATQCSSVMQSFNGNTGS